MLEALFEEFNTAFDKSKVSIESLKKNLSVFSNILLYGAGSAGIAFLHYLRKYDITPSAFIDGDQKKWGTKCEGIDVLSPESIIKTFGENILVIVTINTDGKRYCKSFDEALRIGGHTGVHKRLKELGIRNIVDYTFFRNCYELFLGDEYNLPSCSDVYLMKEKKDNLKEVFEMLTDDFSKETYYKIVKFRMLDDSIEIPTLKQDYQYFEPELYKPIQNETFVDCGAFNGISLRTFLSLNKAFSRYYAFEPDSTNFKALSQYVSTLTEETRNKIELFECAVEHRAGVDTLYKLEGPGSFMSSLGKEPVKTIDIDNALNGNKATYIKMNIEGSELEAIKGCSETIKKYKPILAVAAYHKTWDLWEIPLLVKTMFSGYKVYLRSYMNHISFVYYFIPEGREQK
ncbi:hypothetical protein CLHUN_05910 [Ruminiclostridium hungatei]|uniref:Methyltransferase FkbM domain-containing protein n=1 Tax=Ruminiclostridium hungatei TaxID=48256 RepID=A0A1V4SP90_RUMHU|nr:FkbM family methyltransferase [Ruminiclostridium hungatei]OPX45654.1 hypothetical protein CLHUN_05910 [Ruminiclostridium hungatei]